MAQPKCPYCLSKHDFIAERKCPIYGLEVAQAYIKQYDNVPPLWLVTVGFSKHGKTCYLAALTMMLESIDTIWHETSVRYIDSYTFETVKAIREQAFSGYQPDRTEKNRVPRPLLIHTYDVPEVGSNCLVLYDTAGEYFEGLKGIEEDEGYLRSLKEVKNIWFLVSLKDLEDNASIRIFDLLNIYLEGMQGLNWSLEGRNLIVVYTKADRIFQDLTLPDEIKAYLLKDPFQDLTNKDSQIPSMTSFSFGEYVEEMQEVSDLLKEYTRTNIPTGGQFIALANRYKMGLYFTINSALGSNPDKDNLLPLTAKRYRVLDPFLWAMHLNHRDSSQPIKLILDASDLSDPIYEYSLAEFVEVLGDYGEVTTHYLGLSTQASVSGQNPPQSPPKIRRPRLIGPILERSGTSVVSIVLATGPILDLDDYSRTDWQNRLLLVNMGEELAQNWEHAIVVRKSDTNPFEIIRQEFQRLIHKQPN